MFSLLVNQYPQLCLVEDWLDEYLPSQNEAVAMISVPGLKATPEKLLQGKILILKLLFSYYILFLVKSLSVWLLVHHL